MRFFVVFMGLLLAVSLCDAAIVQRRTYRNTEEILVPVAIVQEGEEAQGSEDSQENAKEPQIENFVPEVSTEEQKVEAAESVVQEAERRIDEDIFEEEIKQPVQEDQDKEISQSSEEEITAGTTIANEPQFVAVTQSENNESLKEPVKEVDENEKVSDYKEDKVVAAQSSNDDAQIEASGNGSANDAEQIPEGNVRQAPAQTTATPFFTQVIQNTIGQFTNPNNTLFPTFPSLPAFPTLPAFPNVQSFISNATQGIQQFASSFNIPGLQQQTAGATTARPGVIQQFLSNIGGNQQNSSNPPQGPFQYFLNLIPGNNNPQPSAAPVAEPSKGPEIVEQSSESAAIEPNKDAADADPASNAVRESGEENDSFEESTQPHEYIVINDDSSAHVKAVVNNPYE